MINVEDVQDLISNHWSARIYDSLEHSSIEALKGLTITSIITVEKNEALLIITKELRTFIMWHALSCCETVVLDDVVGDFKDLLDSPIVKAEVTSNHTENEEEFTSYTWTFYHLSTVKGTVTIKWHGSSNGYYSEEVDFHEVVTEG